MRNEISEEEAEKIFNEHSNFIYRAALFLTNSKDLADDIVQETFIQVFRKYNTYDSKRPLRPWIYKIALNITRNMLRKCKWLKYVEEVPDSSSSNFVETDILKSEEEKELWREINNLGSKSREVLILHFIPA